MEHLFRRGGDGDLIETADLSRDGLAGEKSRGSKLHRGEIRRSRLRIQQRINTACCIEVTGLNNDRAGDEEPLGNPSYIHPHVAFEAILAIHFDKKLGTTP